MKVSVIVPVYNAEKTIERCLDSLMSQTLQEIEVIAVNDASTDGSLEILNAYKEKYPERMVVVDSEINLRAGGARNLGLEQAKGEYIGFVDSDDFVDDIMYERLYEKMLEDDYDYVDCAYYNIDTQVSELKVKDHLCGIINNNQRRELIVIGGFVWSKLYRKEFLDNHGLRFRHKAKLEDADFLIYLNSIVNKVGNVKEVLYLYNKADNETAWSVNKAKLEECDHVISLMRAVYANARKVTGREQWMDAVEAVIINLYLLGINCCIGEGEGEISMSALKKLKELKILKRGIVKGGYENQFVKNTQTIEEIKLMKYIDQTVLGI